MTELLEEDNIDQKNDKNKHLDEIINDLSYEEDALKEQVSNLIGIYDSYHDLDNVDNKEIYGHIRALYYHLDHMRRLVDNYNGTAKNVLEGWKILNDRLKDDPELAECWDTIMVAMKLKDN